MGRYTVRQPKTLEELRDFEAREEREQALPIPLFEPRDRHAPEHPISVLFVCLGNICRSPTAKGVFAHLVSKAGLADQIVIDSAGTGDYHIGAAPDPRACLTAAQRGYDLSALRGRQVCTQDFAQFDYVLAMDDLNFRELMRLCPPEHAHKVKLFTKFCSIGAYTIPDPYAGTPEDFERVLDLVEDAARGLLRHLRGQLKP